MKPYCLMTESELQEAVAKYIVQQYPDVLFHSDFGSGTKLTKNQAARQKRQNGYRKGWPDVFIAEPRTTSSYYERGEGNEITGKVIKERLPLAEEINTWAFEEDSDSNFGLFLELKKDGTRLKKKNGEWATEHIAEQAKVLEQLRERGYVAEFAVGFDEAKRIIDEYLGVNKMLPDPNEGGYSENDNLETILKDPALAPDKYGTVSKKTVRINCHYEMGNGYYTYYASSALLGLLHQKYGNTTFKEAYAKYKKGEE